MVVYDQLKIIYILNHLFTNTLLSSSPCHTRGFLYITPLLFVVRVWFIFSLYPVKYDLGSLIRESCEYIHMY